jgi:hypothetical protein
MEADACSPVDPHWAGLILQQPVGAFGHIPAPPEATVSVHTTLYQKAAECCVRTMVTAAGISYSSVQLC